MDTSSFNEGEAFPSVKPPIRVIAFSDLVTPNRKEKKRKKRKRWHAYHRASERERERESE